MNYSLKIELRIILNNTYLSNLTFCSVDWHLRVSLWKQMSKIKCRKLSFSIFLIFLSSLSLSLSIFSYCSVTCKSEYKGSHLELRNQWCFVWVMVGFCRRVKYRRLTLTSASLKLRDGGEGEHQRKPESVRDMWRQELKDYRAQDQGPCCCSVWSALTLIYIQSVSSPINVQRCQNSTIAKGVCVCFNPAWDREREREQEEPLSSVYVSLIQPQWQS